MALNSLFPQSFKRGLPIFRREAKFHNHMAELVIRGLFIDKTPEGPEAVACAMLPNITFETLDSCDSFHKALQKNFSETYDVCVVSDDFAVKDISAFISDIKKLEHGKDCIFIQIRKDVHAGSDRTSLTDVGIDSIISRALDESDKEAFEKAMAVRMHMAEIQERVRDLKPAISLMMKEIDDVARDRKRGINRSLSTIAGDLVKMAYDFSDKVMEGYVDTLSEKTKEAAPETASKLEVPDKVLKRNLPKLTEESYKGASSRVWKRLLNKFGV